MEIRQKKEERSGFSFWLGSCGSIKTIWNWKTSIFWNKKWYKQQILPRIPPQHNRLSCLTVAPRFRISFKFFSFFHFFFYFLWPFPSPPCSSDNIAATFKVLARKERTVTAIDSVAGIYSCPFLLLRNRLTPSQSMVPMILTNKKKGEDHYQGRGLR